MKSAKDEEFDCEHCGRMYLASMRAFCPDCGRCFACDMMHKFDPAPSEPKATEATKGEAQCIK